MTAPTDNQLAYWKRLCSDAGIAEGSVSEPESKEDMSIAIDELRKQRKATDSQINLCMRLVNDFHPGKTVPNNFTEFHASQMIRNLSAMRPTDAMLTRLRTKELAVNIDNGRAPATTEACYKRELHATNLAGAMSVSEQLIDQADAERQEWAQVLVDVANVATQEQEDESVPESEGSSVRTRRGAGV